MNQDVHCIRSSQEIHSIREGGRSIANQNLVLVHKANGLALTRFAVLASRSVGGAVQRNRCKRVLRARFWRILPELPQGLDILLIARKSLLMASPAEVDTAVVSLFQRADLFNKSE